MHQLTSVNVATTYQPIHEFGSVRLIHDLLESPREYEHSFERYSSGVLFRLSSGRRVETGIEDYVRRSLKYLHEVERVASPGAYLVDIFPSLMMVPKSLAPFKQELAKSFAKGRGLMRDLQDDVRQDMKTGKAPPCWQRTFLETQTEYGLSDDEGAYVVGILFGAGYGTTAATLMSFVFAMLHHPDWKTRDKMK